MNKYVNYYEKILTANRLYFEALLGEITRSDDLSDKIKKAKKALNFACSNGTGYYSSSVIEDVFLELATKCKTEKINKDFIPNSFLHVMTQAYAIGGHTRVVERWVELSPQEQTHSLFIIDNGTNDIPQRLRNAITNKNGKVIFLDNSMLDMEKGACLRATASGYEYIVLHVHANDVIPLIAFGTTDFHRPIIFYNHADHTFWLGISIADIIADLKTLGQELTLHKRKGANSFILSVPAQHIENIVKKKSLRDELGLPVNKKIILSYGGKHKYNPLLDMNFFEYVRAMLTDDNIVIVQIGLSLKKKDKLTDVYEHERFIVLNAVPHDVLMDYISEADLVIDSFPMPGGTAMIDAISCNIPVLSLKGLVGQFDYIIESNAYCHTMGELIEKSRKILESKDAAGGNVKELKKRLSEKNSYDAFRNNLKTLYSLTPKTHSLHYFENDTNFDFVDSDAFMCHSAISIKQLFSCFGIVVFKRKNFVADKKELCIGLLSNRNKYISFKY